MIFGVCLVASMYNSKKTVVVQPQRCEGYSRLEVLAVALTTALLTTLFYPMYQDYQIRNKILTVMGESSVVTEAVTEHYFSNAMLPDSNASAGLKASTEYESELVKSIKVGEGGAITIALNPIEGALSKSTTDEIVQANSQDASLDGQQITLKPQSSIMGQLIWTCSSTTLDDKHTPVPCGGETTTLPNFIPQTAWQLTK